jgi:uncharacterized protein YsxB (DUF464 family)
MVEVTIYRYEDGRPRGFRVSGHARPPVEKPSSPGQWPVDNYSDRAWRTQLKASGVCGGVSALVLHTVTALRHRLGLEVEYRIGPGGTVCCLPDIVPDNKEERAEFLLDVMIDSIERLAKEYGDFMQVTDSISVDNTAGATMETYEEEVKSHGA